MKSQGLIHLMKSQGHAFIEERKKCAQPHKKKGGGGHLNVLKKAKTQRNPHN